jgi:hypothetical protein
MKDITGYFLLAGSLTGFVLAIQKDASDWYPIIALLVLGYGLNLIIQDKVDEVKNELLEEIENLKKRL